MKGFFRGVVKAIAIVAAAVFFFDNHLSGAAGLVLLGSIAVLFLCLFVWLIFLRDDDDVGGTGYWPPDPPS
jgi:F0F1-type ATP synthase assembly protein I